MNSDLTSSLKFMYHPLNLPAGFNKSETTLQDCTLKRNNVKILSYNLYMRPPPVKTNDCDHKDARLEEFVRHHLDDYDIICNQEVFSTLNSRK